MYYLTNWLILHSGVQPVDDGRIEIYPGMTSDKSDEHQQVELTSVKNITEPDIEGNRRKVTVIEITTTGHTLIQDESESIVEPTVAGETVPDVPGAMGAVDNIQEDLDDGNNLDRHSREDGNPDNNGPCAKTVPEQNRYPRHNLNWQSSVENQNYGNHPLSKPNYDIAIFDNTESESVARNTALDTDSTILKCVVNHNMASESAQPNLTPGNPPNSQQGSEMVLGASVPVHNADSDLTLDDQNSDAYAIPSNDLPIECNILASETPQQNLSLENLGLPNTSLSVTVAHPVNNDNAVPAIHNSTTYRMYTGVHHPVHTEATEQFLPASAQESDIARELRIDIRDGRREQIPEAFGQVDQAENLRPARDSGTSLSGPHSDLSEGNIDRQSDSSSLVVDLSDSELDSGRVSETDSTRDYDPASSTASAMQPDQELLSYVSTV